MKSILASSLAAAALAGSYITNRNGDYTDYFGNVVRRPIIDYRKIYEK